MPTQKVFKRRVRERMSKTGESYTAARRQLVLQHDRAEMARDRLASALELASEERLTAATGRGWAEWLGVLDGWGARDRTHRQRVDYLLHEQGVPAWYSQAVATGYERARGIRLKHQQPTGFTIYASRTVNVPLEVLFEAFADERARARWLTDASMALRSSRAGRIARFDWDGGPTRVTVTLEAKGPTKAAAYVSHERLADADEAARAKVSWKERLATLKKDLESAAPAR
jgi:uncharacterized protein YndB with AHSA1/START domain